MKKYISVFVLVLIFNEIHAQQTTSSAFEIGSYSNYSFKDINFESMKPLKGLVLYNPTSNTYKHYQTSNRNLFAENNKMYQVNLDFSKHPDGFNPYNLKNPFESIALGISNLLFDKIQGKD